MDPLASRRLLSGKLLHLDLGHVMLPYVVPRPVSFCGTKEQEVISIKALLAKSASKSPVRMMSNGYACWLVYVDQPPTSFFQALSEMGGWSVVAESNQALWFFPSIDILQGLARLYSWARLQPMPIAVTVLEAGLTIHEHLGQSISVKKEMSDLSVEQAKRLTVRVSPRVRDLAKDFSGLAFRGTANPDGLTGEWFELEASEHSSSCASKCWLWIIRPQGDRKDKGFLKGWRAYFDRLEAFFNQNKVSYLHAENQTLVLRVCSQRNMARFARELLLALKNREDEPWPCQYLGIELGDNTFTTELVSKYRYLLAMLETNTVYLPLSTIYLLADPQIFPASSRVSQDASKITDLFQVQFVAGASEPARGGLNVFLPKSLISGDKAPCFYCGQRTHPPGRCPSKSLAPGNVQVSETSRFARVDMNELPAVMASMEKVLAADVLKGMQALLGDKGNATLVLGVIFEINMVCQLRMMSMVWRAKGKDWPRGIDNLRAPSEEFLWEAMQHLQNGHLERAQERVEMYVLKAPKDYQPRVLLGFLALEREEFKRALGYWNEAESLAFTSLQRSYLILLQGRMREVQGDYGEAIRLYSRALSESSGFFIARYRQAVCLAKSGRIHEAQALFRELIRNDENYFTMVLLDPEVEGWRSHLLSDLWEIWTEQRAQSREVLGSVQHLPDLLSKWLPEDHFAFTTFQQRIQELNSLVGVNNFVSLARLLNGTIAIKHDIQLRVKKDIEQLTARRKEILERLRAIQREASWFPFQSLLGQFRTLFNDCVEQLNLISHLDLFVPEKFRKAHEAMHNAESGLVVLERKLVLLQSVRNTILFLLLSGKYLLIFELGALVLSGLVSALFYFLAPHQVILGFDLRRDRWMILNISLIFFTFLAVCATALRASSRFEAYKNEMLDESG